MKTKELSLYETPKEVEVKTKPIEESALENGVYKVRSFVQAPACKIWKVTSAKYNAGLDYLETPLQRIPKTTDFYFKSSIVLGSFTGGWVFHSLLFPKSGRLRRFFVPVLCGAIATVACFPETTTKIGKSSLNNTISILSSYTTAVVDNVKGNRKPSSENEGKPK
uniref:Uncharacterized protein LOC100186871 n=1 Tax=Phallusia mammillata TaxID=59560 RepID=A0A6F9DHY5_9ASCI|nr:uncharacterized protein LOC100186871 [Phallusia mammillata]